MGRGMTITKLAFFQTKDKYVAKMQEEHSNMQEMINHLENLVNKLVTDKVGFTYVVDCDQLNNINLSYCKEFLY